MKFNYRKFLDGTNHSHSYSDWDSSLVKVLENAGDALPSYEYHAHIFSLHIERTPYQSGRRRREATIRIVCPDEGNIQIEPSKNLKLEELQQAVEKVVRFLSVMEKSGYVEV